MLVRLKIMTPGRKLCALAICALTVLGGCSESLEGGPGGPELSVNLHEFGTPQKIGTGLLTGTTLDGSGAYLEEPAPQFPDPGCEGRPRTAMFRVDLETGTREMAGDAPPVQGKLIRGGSQGRVALVAECEGFFSDLIVAHESTDGTISGALPVVPTGVPEGFGLNPFSFSWSNDGSALLAAAQDFNAPDGEPTQIVSIDPQDGQVTSLFDAGQGTGVFKVAQLENASYALAINLVVSLRDDQGVETARFRGKNFDVSPDLKRLVLFGEDLSTATQDDTVATELLAEVPGQEITSARFSADGSAVVLNRRRLDSGLVEVAIVTLDDRRFTSVVLGGRYDRSYFSGDGRSLAFNELGEEPDGAPIAYLTTFETFGP